jgi:Ala-tRNA(Pro) deacylase
MLDEDGVEYELLEHEPVYTSKQAAEVRGVSVRTGVKALVLKTKESEYILALVRADKRADLKAVASAHGTKKVKLANPAEVLEITGCEIGSVPPFGHIKALKTYMDRDILKEDEVNFNIGSHTKSVRMKAQDLLKVIKPVLI